MKKSILLSLIILALGGAFRLFQERQLGVSQQDSQKLTAAAGPLGVTGDFSELRLTKRQRDQRADQALAMADEWIAVIRELEALENRGERPDEAFDERMASLEDRFREFDASQLKRILAEVRGNRQISGAGKFRILISGIEAIAETEPAMALALFLECSDLLGKNEDSKDLLTSTLSGLATTNPYAAAEWIARNTNNYAANADDYTHSVIISSIAETDPQLAFKLLGNLQFEDPSNAIQAIIATAEDHPEKRDAILAALRGHLATVSNAEEREKLRGESFESFARNLGKEDIDSVQRWIEKSQLTPEEKSQFAAGLSYSATQADTGRWVEWLSANVPADSLAEPVKDMVGDWTQQDYQAAGQWLATAPENSAKHPAILAYAAAVAEYEPQVAGQWAMTLPPGPVRAETLKVIYQNWPSSDPVGAATFAREHGME